MSGEGGQILLPVEAEAYVEALETFDVKEIGSPRWSLQHDHLEKLNMQAVLCASQQQDEFIKEFIITHGKIPILIRELIAVEIWKQKIFPEFEKLDLKQTVVFPIYMVLYHEATIVTLLETIMYHQDAAEGADDTILDLVDYCYRKITELIAKTQAEEDFEDEEEDKKTDLNSITDQSSLQELQTQNKTLSFDISIKALSILRYIIDHLAVFPLSAISRILNTHDVPVLLVQLVENPPWTKTNSEGKLEKYMENKWQVIPDSDRFKLTKTEGQVWLALFQLLMGQDCQRKYELDPYKKNALIKLRAHLTEIMLDQLPVLGEMQRYLEQLAIMEPPPIKKDLVLEQVPEIWDDILSTNEGKWGKIAKKQSKNFFNPSKVDMRAQAKRLADTYSSETLESMISEPPKCALCGEEATKRCSRCQNEWYCKRECQVNHWKKHKKACDLMKEATDRIKDNEQNGITQSA